MPFIFNYKEPIKMKPAKFLLSALSVAMFAVTFSACNQNAAVNNTTTANTANQSNTAVVVNSNSTATNTAGTASSAPSSTASVSCDVTAYVMDKDPNGFNVRDSDSEKGAIIGKIPLDKEGTVVHIVSSSPSGWVQIDKATTTADKVTFNKKGWVSANLLEVATRGYDAGGVNLYEAAKGSKVSTKIPEDMVVKILGCDGKRMQVKYKDSTGWLDPDSRCDHPATRCN